MPLTVSGHNPIVATGGTGTVFGNQGTGGVEFSAVHVIPIRVSRIRWVFAGAAAGNACIIQDIDGNTIFESEATGANWSDETDFKDVVMLKGLVIQTLTGGTVYIHLK